MRRASVLLGSLLALLLAMPLVVLATPAPTAPPATSGGGAQPAATPAPERSPVPTQPPSQAFVVPAPDRPGLTVGYSGNGVRPQAPLLVAEEAGYFDDAGFTQVTVARVGEVLADVATGDLDFGVVPAAEAYAGFAADPTLRAVAGYRNYVAGTGEYRGDLLVAAPDLVAQEPATVLAFLSAYLRALDLLSTEEGAREAYDIIAATDLALDVDVARWTRALEAFAPFDGGFGSLAEGDGLGDLAAYLVAEGVEEPDLDGFIADHTLAIAQTWRNDPANPANRLAGPPGIGEISVALPGGETELSPIPMAVEDGRFADAGFDGVVIVDVAEPLLGLLQGQVEFGVMDLVDVTEAAAQGLPLTVIAGHRNDREDGSFGDDVLVTATDLFEQEGSTVSAFLVGYIAALQDLAAEPDAAAFAPFDGGFAERDGPGGLDDIATAGALAPLEYAQAWWGLPANPNPTSTNEDRE